MHSQERRPKQVPFTIVTPIEPERVEDLRNILEPVGKNIDGHKGYKPPINFYDYNDLHYCCFVIIDDRSKDGFPESTAVETPVLVFEGNIDCDVNAFLAEMIERNSEWLASVYSCCEKVKESNLLSYLLQHDVGADAYYVAWPGVSASNIKDDRCLRSKIGQYLNKDWRQLRKLSPAAIVDQVREFVKSNVSLGGARSDMPFNVRYGTAIFNSSAVIIIVTLLSFLFGLFGDVAQNISVIMLSVFVLLGFGLRWYELTDPQTPATRSGKHVTTLVQTEHRQHQTHLTSITSIKAGWLREFTLRAVLLFTSLSARFVATKGNLSGIVTIHFARWVIIDGNSGSEKRLLFLSNYDGSWENYLGEFIDHASIGLTAIWSNTTLGGIRGFPYTSWLVFGGSRDEQRFKSIARDSQYPEQIWFSAYKDVSVQNIRNNSGVRELLDGGTETPENWLQRF